VEKTHLTRFLMFFREQGMQRRVADHTEDQQRPSQDEPGTLCPTLVRAPQSPARHGSARHHIQKTRHTRNIRLRRHLLTSSVDDFQRYASYQMIHA
jgi:hypothetical protein